MKSALIFPCIILYGIITTNAQLPKEQQKAIVIKRMIELKHYSPRPVNDEFSMFVFKNIINTADKRRLFFTETEYKQLAAYSASLDDELNGKGWAFVDLFSVLYKKALMRADTIIQKLTQRPFDFSINDTASFSKDESFSFTKDNVALMNRWAKYLRYSALNDIYEELNEDSIQAEDFKTTVIKQESLVRGKIKKTELKSIHRILGTPAEYSSLIEELYLDAIASAFDPHTNYFSAERKEEFQSELSTEAYSFGLEFDKNNKGQLIIDQLIPGGPAWKSGELHKGDELLSLQWEGKEAVDLGGATLEDVYAVLNQSMHDRLVFKFRKADGTTTTVMMRKEKIENEENIVKSFILKGEKKIGYILLPGFYTEWENESGSRCANDVAKEIVKLKKENIDGLILDVRFNGGGSMGEALDMAGIFINEGPLASEKGKDGKQITLKDPNRGTIYDGPLALMVNKQSASASEMLAATLQDYNRAVIVGGTTYGKATMQQMFSVDTMSNKALPGAGKEMLKITAGKLYRLTGESAQKNGVTPDIELPDVFDGIEFGEKFSLNALLPDTAKRNAYYTPLPALPTKELSQKSWQRVQKDTAFQNIKQVTSMQNRFRQIKMVTVPLKWDKFEKWKKEQDTEWETLPEGKSTGLKIFTAENHQADKEAMKDNSYAKEVNDVWLENISEDIYIRETFLIMCDLINLQKSATKN